ncbi:MAG TPA: hypothetical protein VHE80_11010 [Acidimicrobiales bacterium]|nr:hypothetical protein [Acidimicrobiales bacterium]
MRELLGVAAGAVTAAVGALVVGEYSLAGVTGVVAGVVFGLVVAEVVVTVGRRQDLLVAVPTAAIVVAGLVWAAWIWSGRPWSRLPAGAVAAAAAGAVVSLAWVTGPKLRSAGRREDGTPPAGPSP